VVENAGFGATWAGSIASLMMEKYLKDSVSSKRKCLEEKMYNANLVSRYTYAIDSAMRHRDAMRREQKLEFKRLEDSTARAADSIKALNFFRRYYHIKK
jgi:penicillin-binding protein 2